MRSLTIFIIVIICSSCATYYQTNSKFNQKFEKGKLELADKLLEENQKAAEGKAKLLYYLNRGVVNSILGNYEQSNLFFEKAYQLGEDYQKNYLNQAVSLFTNPNIVQYKGEDHELLLIHYYKALNFLKMGENQAALVECRRLNIKLKQLSDKYRSGQKFKRDAFIHNLMGIIYDADQDYNNAFIAYRNALEIYQEDYQSLFGVHVPEQLKQDLMRTAYLTGFHDELKQYEEHFNLKYKHDKAPHGDLVFFWNNGLGPVKSEWGINFALVRGQGGAVFFRNDQHSFNFPFYLENEDEFEEKGLNKLEFVRIAFPKYIERPKLFSRGSLTVNGQTFELELGEDINAIAFKSLNQRMLKELSMSLLRVAIKKASEYSLREENDDLGAILGAINAFTEKADTRNWQTIPHSIYYTRVPLPEGEHSLAFNVKSNGETYHQNHDLNVTIKNGHTRFHTFHSLEIDPGFQQPYPYFSMSPY